MVVTGVAIGRNQRKATFDEKVTLKNLDLEELLKNNDGKKARACRGEMDRERNRVGKYQGERGFSLNFQ